MKNIGIFYASDTGNTELIAEKIAKAFGEEQAQVFDVSDADASDMEAFSNLIFSSPTWGSGDLQDDFDEFMEEIAETDFEGKTVALFGLGDGVTYEDTFVDAMGQIYEALEAKSCKIVGNVSTEGYDFDESLAEKESGKFVGLAIDEDNQDDLTDERIEKWVAQLKNEFQ